MKRILLTCIVPLLILGGCETIRIGGAYEDERGRRYEGSAAFTLPTKGGYAK